MKAIRIHGLCGPEVLELDDVPIPQPGAGELLVRISAASVNPVDYKIRRGTVPWVSREMFPITLGRNLSGTVENAGAEVGGFAAGEAVMQCSAASAAAVTRNTFS
jgi:NADPH:quinone reductase-like Zn-dependent oxidoreductase